MIWKKNSWGDWNAEIGQLDACVSNARATKRSKRPWEWEICKGKLVICSEKNSTAEHAMAEAERMLRGLQ